MMPGLVQLVLRVPRLVEDGVQFLTDALACFAVPCGGYDTVLLYARTVAQEQTDVTIVSCTRHLRPEAVL